MIPNHLLFRLTVIFCLVVGRSVFPANAQNAAASSQPGFLPLVVGSEYTYSELEKFSIPVKAKPSVISSDVDSVSLPQSVKPVSKDEFVATLALNLLTVKEFIPVSMKELVKRVGERGVDFQMTTLIEEDLRKAGGNDEVIQAARSAYRATSGDGLAPSSASAYFDLLKQAASALKDKQVEKAGNLLEDAIKLDSTLAMAYEYLGHIQFYRYPSIKGRDRKADSAAAEAHLRAAIERGGEAMFVVIHGHGFGSSPSLCGGTFIIRKSSITYQMAAPPGLEMAVRFSLELDHSFYAEKSSIKKLETPWDARGGFRITLPNPQKPGEMKQFRFQAVQFFDDGTVDMSYGHYAKLILSLINDYH